MSHFACRDFGPEPREVATARHFARSVAEGWGLDVGDLELVVGELAANAVLHARSPYSVSLRLRGEHLEVEVADRNVRVPSVPEAPTRALSGRGLAIVGQVTIGWGVRAQPEGKVVWAELPAQARPVV